MNSVYITSVGKFLPGSPVSNDEMEEYLGKIGGKSSKTKRLILEKNQIRSRYYAMDKEQKSLYTNAEMASLAIRDALERNGNVTEQDINFLATGTTRADLLLPGFASMVHAETGLPPMEIASHSGLCASGMHALKNAYVHIKAGEHRAAIACSSEFLSRESNIRNLKHRGFIAIIGCLLTRISYVLCFRMAQELPYCKMSLPPRGHRCVLNGSITSPMRTSMRSVCIQA